jgi:hypothetical protein
METKKYIMPEIKVVSVRFSKMFCASYGENVQMDNYLDQDNLDW